MNIDTSRLTYNPIRSTSRPTQDFEAQPNKVDSPEFKPHDEVESKALKQPNASEKTEPKPAQWTSPLSNYLSPEEKAMLNQLFPPPGRDTGIRAYKQGQQPVRSRMELGKQIDVTT
jgi:hypothetical protein